MKKTTVITRRYRGHIEDVWQLWTTKDGIEAWWGPDGFAVDVLELSVVVDGVLVYEMYPTQSEMVAFMRAQGMPTRTRTSLRFTEVRPQSRLAWTNHVGFIPGVAPYENATAVDFDVDGAEVVVTLHIEAMHDDLWTGRQVAGWESELGRLGAALEQRPITKA